MIEAETMIVPVRLIGSDGTAPLAVHAGWRIKSGRQHL